MNKSQAYKENRNLTWDELADDYDACHSGRPARTLELDYVFDWAEGETNRYRVTEEGTIRYVKEEENG